jgi:hypothetical protein
VGKRSTSENALLSARLASKATVAALEREAAAVEAYLGTG